jgi:hypothetical protein
VLQAPFRKANIEAVRKMRRTIKFKTLLKAATNLKTVREALTNLNKKAAARKAAGARSASTDDAVMLQQQIAQEPEAGPAIAAIAPAAAPAVDDIAGH